MGSLGLLEQGPVRSDRSHPCCFLWCRLPLRHRYRGSPAGRTPQLPHIPSEKQKLAEFGAIDLYPSPRSAKPFQIDSSFGHDGLATISVDQSVASVNERRLIKVSFIPSQLQAEERSDYPPGHCRHLRRLSGGPPKASWSRSRPHCGPPTRRRH